MDCICDKNIMFSAISDRKYLYVDIFSFQKSICSQHALHFFFYFCNAIRLQITEAQNYFSMRSFFKISFSIIKSVKYAYIFISRIDIANCVEL